MQSEANWAFRGHPRILDDRDFRTKLLKGRWSSIKPAVYSSSMTKLCDQLRGQFGIQTLFSPCTSPSGQHAIRAYGSAYSYSSVTSCLHPFPRRAIHECPSSGQDGLLRDNCLVGIREALTPRRLAPRGLTQFRRTPSKFDERLPAISG